FAFFYLLTGLHMVHLLGGLSVWSFSVYKTFNEDISVNELRSTISLSTMYWHFLLIVWIFLFGLLLAT
ncbi:MAG: cytochrome c oxidase subunit 3, partial [Pseudomonadota bacterium]|nr:cytochrome c oxidase subunit 3 [Pseudomonadota bacterium]